MHEPFPSSGDRPDFSEPANFEGQTGPIGDVGYDGVVCDSSDESDIPDSPPDTSDTTGPLNDPASADQLRPAESGENTGEWLSKIDVDTTLEDVMTRPSVFNPYPDHATGGLQVWSIYHPTGNPQCVVRYPESNTEVQAILPTGNEVPFEAARMPELREGSEVAADSQNVELPDEGEWLPITTVWETLSADLAHRHLLQQDGHEAVRQVKELVAANADPEASGEVQYGGKYINPHPEEFVRQGLAAAQKAIEEGHPARGYAIASETFRGFSYQSGDTNISNTSTFLWTTDKSGMSAHLFPNFAEPWDGLEPHRITSEAHPWHIGRDATTIVKSRLGLEAVDGWMQTAGATAPQAVTEKVSLLRQRLVNEGAQAEAELKARLEMAAQQYPSAVTNGEGERTWEVPERLSDHIMNRLALQD